MPRHMESIVIKFHFPPPFPCRLSLYCLVISSARPPFSFPPPIYTSPWAIPRPQQGGGEDRIGVLMEGGKKPSSSIADELFPTGKYAPPPSTSPGYFSSVFPPASSVLGKSQGNPSKTQTLRRKDGKSVSSSRSEESAYFGSSVHYGGRDFYDSSASNQPSGAPKPWFQIKDLDKGENSNDPNAANRGEWWQGSLYY